MGTHEGTVRRDVHFFYLREITPTLCTPAMTFGAQTEGEIWDLSWDL